MQMLPLQEMVFKTLVEKTKIYEEVKLIERKRKEQVRALTERDYGPNG